jgi:hypothetical protein
MTNGLYAGSLALGSSKTGAGRSGVLGAKNVGKAGSSIIEWIRLTAHYFAGAAVVVIFGFTHGLQMIFDLLPVVAGVPVHLSTLAAILLPTVAGF